MTHKLGTLSAIAALVLVFSLIFIHRSDFSCEARNELSHVSPENRWVATERIQRCGSALGSLEVLIDLKPIREDSKIPVNVWRAFYSYDSGPVVIDWVDDKNLKISYPKDMEVTRAKYEIYGISIRYIKR